MANKVKQYRFYGTDTSDSSRNQPKTMVIKDLTEGTVFQTPITQLGIQSLPGTKFYLNNSAEPVVIGTTGIYELDLNNETQITSLQFDIASINTIANNNSAYLLVDILYDDIEEA